MIVRLPIYRNPVSVALAEREKEREGEREKERERERDQWKRTENSVCPNDFFDKGKKKFNRGRKTFQQTVLKQF